MRRAVGLKFFVGLFLVFAFPIATSAQQTIEEPESCDVELSDGVVDNQELIGLPVIEPCVPSDVEASPEEPVESDPLVKGEPSPETVAGVEDEIDPDVNAGGAVLGTSTDAAVKAASLVSVGHEAYSVPAVGTLIVASVLLLSVVRTTVHNPVQ